MLLEELRNDVLEANLELVRQGLVLHTFGNASGISRKDGLVAIKPSGVAYESMTAADIVITDMAGKVVDGKLKPSSDLQTHLLLYKSFSGIGAVVHTHSEYATAWAQAGQEIPCFGTTHADYFHGAVPVTAELTKEEIDGDYVVNTGHAITRRMEGLDAAAIPGVLVRSHAPFCWGATPADAAHNAVVLENIAKMAFMTRLLNPKADAVSQALLDRHYLRKHGAHSTYGQKD
jgi:L-ribulose-5-phosphate 4-epimerase